MIYGKTIGKKFDENGNVLHYPGNTVVAKIGPGCSAYDVMLTLRQMVIDAGFEEELILLPKDSYHMTVFRGLNDYVRKDSNWPSVLPKDTPMTKVDDHVTNAVTKAGLPGPVRMKFDHVNASPGCIEIYLLPADAEQEKILRDFRDRAAEGVGVFFPKHDEYRFHISLAYVRVIPEGERAEQFDKLKVHMDDYISNQAEFYTGQPYMAYFDDMMKFHSERIGRD